MAKEKKAKKQRSLSIFEMIWYPLCGAVALWGLVYIILDLIGQYLPMMSADNPLKTFSNTIQSTFGLTPYYWGIIIFAIGIIAIVIVLVIYSKKYDRNYEKEQRRAAIRASARAARESTEVVEAEPVEEAVEAVEAPVEEAPAEESEEAPVEESETPAE